METIPHILVVDDDREIRDLLAKFLERQRLRVTSARDGKEARRAFMNGHFQLVVLDLMLPGEGGLDLARWFRGESKVPIIMLTAMAEETDRIIGLELGATIMSPSRSIRGNFWPASAPCCAAPARATTRCRKAPPNPTNSPAGCWKRPAGGCWTRRRRSRHHRRRVRIVGGIAGPAKPRADARYAAGPAARPPGRAVRPGDRRGGVAAAAEAGR